MNTRKNAIRLLGLAMIAFLTVGVNGVAADSSSPCIKRINGCWVCEANGGSCSVEFCPDGSTSDNCL